MSKLYAGIDFHKHNSVIRIVDDQGEVKEKTTIRSRLLRTFFSNREGIMLGIESSGGVNPVVEELREDGHQVVIVNSNQFRGIGVGGKKTDDRDALAIAHCLRMNFVPQVHLKSRSSRELKSLVVNRELMVRQRVNLTNHIRGTLREYGINMPAGVKEFWSQAGEKITRIENDLLRECLQESLELARKFKAREEQIENYLESLLKENPDAMRLRKVPGIGPMSTAMLIAVTDDVNRFKNAKEFASYLGLTPSEHSSGDKRRMGRITRSGSEILRRYLIHGARNNLTYSRPNDKDPNRRWARQVKDRAGFNKAVVALAHRTARIAYNIMKNQTQYDPSMIRQLPPQETEAA